LRSISGERPVHDGAHVVEPHLQQRLDLDALYGELGVAQLGVDAGRQLRQVEHLREERNLGLQVVYLDVEVLEAHHWRVEQDVGDPVV
jgi:hypothetical protein